MKSNCKKKQGPRGRYELGSFVTQNSDVSQQYQSQINALQKPVGGQTGNTTLSGLATGASIGTGILPGWGTAIGAVVGGIGGLLLGSSADKREKANYANQIKKLNTQRSNITKDLYESAIDINNENPYGIYAKGGDVLPSIDPTINIEKGELQVNPETGKIIREFTGINPETGGLYEKHNKKGKDSKNNMVTAKEGSFIITKKDASKYKDAVENNDKFYQNAIMSNIRNKKKEITNKYADGGFIDPFNMMRRTPRVSTQNNPIPYLAPTIGASSLNAPLNIPSNLASNPTVSRSNIQAPVNWGSIGSNIANTAMNYLPSIYNMISGSRQPNQLPFTPTRLNIENRQRILSNLPQDVSVNPALNNIRRSRNRAYTNINANTASPTISRANRLALEDSFIGAENEALYNNQLMNNQIRGQRASILSNLDAQDTNRTMQNINSLNNTLLTNMQLQKAKTDQFNYGLSQAQQMYQNNRANKDRQRMQQQELEILRQVFPVIGQYYPSLTGGV